MTRFYRRTSLGVGILLAAVLLGVMIAPNHVTQAFHLGDGFSDDFPLPGLDSPDEDFGERNARQESPFQSNDHRRLCNKLRRYCQTQIRSNEAAQKALGKAGVQQILPEPPVCASERSVCGFFYDEDDCHCPRVYQPVCATNGRTYENECLAQCRGKSVAHQGSCGIFQFPSSAHSSFSFSSFPTLPPPMPPPSSSFPGCMCTQEYNPVCGTDGRTYPNPCYARCANVGTSHGGACVYVSSRGFSSRSSSSFPQQYCTQVGTCFHAAQCPTGSYCTGYPNYRCLPFQCSPY